MPERKLSRTAARKILVYYASGQWTQAELAQRYGVSQSRISRLTRHYAFHPEPAISGLTSDDG